MLYGVSIDGEVGCLCRKCKKVIMANDEYCPYCGEKTDASISGRNLTLEFTAISNEISYCPFCGRKLKK